MSVKFETVKIEQQVVESYTCDGCGKVIDRENWIEIQEMLHWRMTGGYGSIFGDGASISLDLCQECVKKHLGDILQIGPGTVEQIILAMDADETDD